MSWCSFKPMIELPILLCCLLAWGATTAEFKIQGTGGVLPSRLYWDAFFAYRFVKPSVQLTYFPTTSSQGICALKGGSETCGAPGGAEQYFDFAGTDTPVPESDYEQLPDLQLYPTVASAVVPIYNLGKRCPALTLSPSLLASIFAGKVSHWNDPQIRFLNPTCDLPDNETIEVVMRADANGVTDIFQKSLSSFAAFDSSFAWASSSSTVTMMNGNQAMISYVLLNPFTIGYSGLDLAERNGLRMVRLQKYSGIVEASANSVGFAVLELGLNFGNNGDDPEHLTADIHGAHAALAWPIAGYSYLAVRKNWKHPGATCQDVKEMVAFGQWFWTSPVVAEMAYQHGFSSLPQAVRDVVLERFLNDIYCDGFLVWDQQEKVLINGAGPASANGLFEKLPAIYSLVQPEVVINFTAVPAIIETTVDAQLADEMFVVTRSSWRPEVTNGATLVFAGIGLVVISRYELTLDGHTLANILDGVITDWCHPDIQALNPDGVLDVNHESVSDSNHTIKLIGSPLIEASWIRMMSKYKPTYSNAALRIAPFYDTFELVQSVVAGTPYSLGIVVFSGELLAELRIARFKRLDGNIVHPSWKSIQACGSPDVFHSDSSFVLQNSQVPTCYPLSDALYLTVKKSECSIQTDAARTETINFLEWLFSDPNLSSALQENNLAPLCGVLPVVDTANTKALEYLSCQQVVRSSFGLAQSLAIFIPVAAVMLIVALVGSVFLWKAIANLHALRKQFSNTNVAQQCAEAIACFDLEAVAWLDNVSQPNKVQSAFLRIIHLLKEVKPFVPDQLLQSLRNGTFGCEEPPHSPKDQHWIEPQEIADARAENPEHSGSSTPVCNASSSHLDGEELSCIISCKDRSKSRIIPRAANRLSLFIPPPAFSDGKHQRQCTYLFVRFEFRDDVDLPKGDIIQELGNVAVHIIGIGKAAKATIDYVTANTVAFHWGADGTGASTLTATKAAMEMAQSKITLPLALQDAFEMQIGLGQGLCTTTTLCAASHRFLVIMGPEVTLPVDFVFLGLPKRCQCTLLVSSEVFQKVQYWVHCFPRIRYKGVLLWEPVRMNNESSEASEEWMYELQQMNRADTGSFNGRVLEKVFHMAHHGALSEELRQEVQDIKERYEGELTAKDLLCLDMLLSHQHPRFSA